MSGQLLTTTTSLHVTFGLAGLLFGIEVDKVQEVLRPQQIVAVPLGPYAVEGLINLRGKILVAINTRRSLNLPSAPFDASPMHVVLHAKDGPVSLLVDAIHDVIFLPLNSRASVPDTMPATQRRLLSCIYNLPVGIVLILDTERLLDSCV